ncbi:putative ribonuclease H-like domain-containing protein [Tanacetum coccineum]
MDDFCREKGIKREYSVARTPQQNRVAERRNRTLIEAARTMLVDSKLPSTFWAEVVSTACYVHNTVLVVKPHNKTPYELFRDSLGKFDGKIDEGFFVGYSLSSKAFRVYNTRTRRVEEKLHIGFLENKPMIEGNGPKWLFDIDSLTQSMNYVPVVAGTIINESADKSDDVSSPKEVNAVGQHATSPSVNTASSYDQDSPKDKFTMGASHTLEATHVELFSDEDEPEVDLGNIENSYTVEAIQEELLQFKLQEVWKLVDLPNGKRVIGTKWVFRNKKYERGIVIRNKASLCSFMGFLVLSNDVTCAILYGTIRKRFMLSTPRFKISDHQDTFTGGQGTLWVISSSKSMLCTAFEKLMKDKFQMSSIGELTFFLGLQVGDEAVHKELGDMMERAATTASSLEAEQDSGNINRTPINGAKTINGRQVLREIV